ncbi:uncharacterized protein LOC106173406, partial [Lingula anatina]|uniref:Uncharacterized protein LOC106173406 n=1 Tax=Lingula anatina TaxID=7574 RepID=A0A1S3JJB3_LINAN
VLVGSHKAGRQNHHRVGGQNGIDEERIEHLAKVCPLKYVELEPGDALIFNANLIHKSDANNSNKRRWSFLVSYNTKENNPVYVHHHAQYTPLDVVPNSAIKTCTNFTDMTGKEFLDPSIDKTVIADKTNPVPNSAIKTCTNFTDMTGKEFLDPSIDKTVIADKTNPVKLPKTSE